VQRGRHSPTSRAAWRCCIRSSSARRWTRSPAGPQDDPSCGIALWGTGVAQWSNPFSTALRPAAQLESGRATLERAAGDRARRPARERDFINAAGRCSIGSTASISPPAGAPIVMRWRSCRRPYPDDPEAAAFYALSLAAAGRARRTRAYADQLKAGAILEKLWAAQPDHPGFPHYIIHSYDVPALAPRAVDAARRYAKIAPAAPHALHMPSHTFTRLGYWQDSIDTNILSAAAARKVNAIGEELHASDYQTYAYLQGGQDAAARRVVDSLAEIVSRRGPATASAAPPPAGTYARAAIPARYALERGAWAEAAALETRESPYPYADSLTWFARALGAARMRDVPAGASGGSRTAEVRRSHDAGAGNLLDRTARHSEARGLGVADLVEGKTDAALAAMRTAADREDRTEESRDLSRAAGSGA
jgi:hypothetical protein